MSLVRRGGMMKSSLQQWTIIILGLASIAGLIAAAPGRTKPLSKNIDMALIKRATTACSLPLYLSSASLSVILLQKRSCASYVKGISLLLIAGSEQRLSPKAL
jgi:hypothetical protein